MSMTARIYGRLAVCIRGDMHPSRHCHFAVAALDKLQASFMIIYYLLLLLSLDKLQASFVLVPVIHLLLL